MILKKQRPKIGLALGCGGARGFAHIGVIKMLEKHNIPIDMIAGSSAGAFVGGLYAAKQNVEIIENAMLNINSSTVFSLLFDPCFNQGISSGNKLKKFFTDSIGDISFNDLAIPFSTVATNLKSGECIVLNEGNVTEAIHASSAIPFLFKPVEHKDYLLTDGGISMPVPVQTVKNMGADIMIGVNLCQEYFLEGYSETLGLSNMFLNSLNILSHHLAHEQMKHADIGISPRLKHLRWKLNLSLAEKQNIIQIGATMMEKEIPAIKKLIEERSIPAWKTYMHAIPTTPKYIHNQTLGFIENIKIMKKILPNFLGNIFSKNPLHLNK
jgi:NTE family protein